MRARFVLAATVVLWGSASPAADPLPVKTIEYESPSVGRTLKYNIALPRTYDSQTDRRHHAHPWLLIGRSQAPADGSPAGRQGSGHALLAITPRLCPRF